MNDEESDHRPHHQRSDQRQVVTERSTRDLSKGWLPITVVASIVLSVGVGVWWAAGEHAEIIALKIDRDRGEKRDQEQSQLIAEQAKAIASIEKTQAATLATLEGIRSEVQHNSAILEDLRRRP